MKKIKKIIIIIILVIVLLFGIDFLSIAITKKPLFILDRDKCGCANKEYYGLFYNTYYCEDTNKVYVLFKNKSFSCESEKNTIVIGIITDIKESYIVIEGVSDNNYLTYKNEAHISLDGKTKIIGANNLIIGQMVKANIIDVKEIYPPIITVSEIEIIHNYFTIIDKTQEIEDFICAEALEEFYEDQEYKYFYSCIKSNYIIVKYSNGEEQTVKEALKTKKITIEDVLNSNVKVYKKAK